MNYLKYTQYLYLIVAIVMIVNGFMELNSGTDKPYISFFLAAVAVGMFFFRRIMAKKFDNQNNN
jgi:hypothetical protein